MSGRTRAVIPLLQAAGRVAAWIVVAALPLTVFGCAYVAGKRPVLPPDVQRTVAASYAEKIRQAESCRQFEADVRVRFDYLFKNAVLSGILLAKSPQSLKFVGLSPLGQPLAFFVLAGQSFILVDVPSQKAFQGTSGAAKVSDLFPFEKLEGTGLYSLLSGTPVPGEAEDAQISDAGADQQGSYLLSWPTSFGGQQRVEFDPRSNRVQRYQLLDRAGFILLQASYGGYDEQKCGLPKNIVITGEEVKGRIELELERIELTHLSDDDFKVRLPAGYRLETVR